jgi:caffeoyl-CoA O-methyltransferase
MTDPLDLYAARHTAPEPPLLAQLTRETHLQLLMPRMSSGHVQGRLLSMLSHLMRPQRVLEIGTFCGYATLCLAEGLALNGLLHTIEIDPEREARIRRYVAAAGITEQVRLHIGAALDVLPGLVDEVWDLVFIDADKRNNGAYFEAVVDQVRPGGTRTRRWCAPLTTRWPATRAWSRCFCPCATACCCCAGCNDRAGRPTLRGVLPSGEFATPFPSLCGTFLPCFSCCWASRRSTPRRPLP